MLADVIVHVELRTRTVRIHNRHFDHEGLPIMRQAILAWTREGGAAACCVAVPYTTERTVRAGKRFSAISAIATKNASTSSCAAKNGGSFCVGARGRRKATF